MVYSVTITTVKDTSKLDPLVTQLKVTKGLVYRVEVDFPPGPAGLMGVVILDGGFQVWPSTLGQWFTGDGVTIAFDDVYLKETEPFEFSIETYNTDDTYFHGVTVRIGMVSKEIFMARFLPHMSYKYFEQMMVRLEARQVAEAAAQAEEIKKTAYEVLFG